MSHFGNSVDRLAFAIGACVMAAASLEACASTNSTHGTPADDASAKSSTAGAGASAPGAIASLREKAIASRGAAQIVQSLTDEVGPRLAGSKGDKAAVEWAVHTLKARGFANVHTEPVAVPHWERGDESGAIVSPIAQPLSLTALGGSIGTPPNGIEAEVLEVDSLDALEKVAKEAVAGKIVFYNVSTPRARDGSGYMKAVPVRGVGALRAAKLGAVGVVIRSIGTDHNRLPHTGAMRREENAPTVPAAALSTPDAELLHRLVAQRGSVRIRLKLGCRSLPDEESANVIGEIPGVGKLDEIVLLGAHLDSWDLGTGAIDDGAGIGIVVHASEVIGLLPHRPLRTIRVVLFANEENGLSGSRAYAQAHRGELDRHIAALEADAGTGRGYGVRYLGSPEARGRLAEIAAELKPVGIALLDDDAHGGADLGPLRALGVPMVDVAQDTSTYFDFHHTANDTFDKIDPEALAQVSAAFAVLAAGIASLNGDLGRVPLEKRQPSGARPLRVAR